MSFNRFKQAQDSPESGFEVAQGEMNAGRKTSHWIWYILPQLAGLGRSETARFYGLADLAEAKAYFRDPILRKRLELIVSSIASRLAEGISLGALMGGATDSLKTVSCLTLFRAVATEAGSDLHAGFVQSGEAILATAFREGVPRCAYTERAVGQEFGARAS